MSYFRLLSDFHSLSCNDNSELKQKVICAGGNQSIIATFQHPAAQEICEATTSRFQMVHSFQSPFPPAAVSLSGQWEKEVKEFLILCFLLVNIFYSRVSLLCFALFSSVKIEWKHWTDDWFNLKKLDWFKEKCCCTSDCNLNSAAKKEGKSISLPENKKHCKIKNLHWWATVFQVSFLHGQSSFIIHFGHLPAAYDHMDKFISMCYLPVVWEYIYKSMWMEVGALMSIPLWL